VRPRHAGPAKRLLVPPLLLIATVLAVVVGVGLAAPERDDPSLRVDGLAAPLPLPDQGCRRDHDDRDLAPAPIETATGRITSELVLSCPARFDQRTVTYVGELVGDLLHRRGGAWVQVNDDDYALVHGPLPAHRQHAGTNSGLSVWLPAELLDEVTGLGRPGVRGDVVRLDGVLWRTDPEDGGGLTLRARTLDVLRPATEVAEPFDVARAAFALVSILVAVALGVARPRHR
jgi:hypothetical protein